MTIQEIETLYVNHVLTNQQADRRIDLIVSEIRSLEQRRQAGVAVFVPFQTVLITIVALFAEVLGIDSNTAKVVVAALLVIGCFSAIVWISHAKGHTELLSWWYSRLRVAERSSSDDSGGDFCAEFAEFFPKNRSYFLKFVFCLGAGAILLNICLAIGIFIAI